MTLENVVVESMYRGKFYDLAVEQNVEIIRLNRQLRVARGMYDEEHPAEDGHDQVYPWDHV